MRHPRMSENYELGRCLRRREKNANEAGAGRFEKPAPDARAAPPEAHESLFSRKTAAEVPLTALSFRHESSRVGGRLVGAVMKTDHLLHFFRERFRTLGHGHVGGGPRAAAPRGCRGLR